MILSQDNLCSIFLRPVIMSTKVNERCWGICYPWGQLMPYFIFICLNTFTFWKSNYLFSELFLFDSKYCQLLILLTVVLRMHSVCVHKAVWFYLLVWGKPVRQPWNFSDCFSGLHQLINPKGSSLFLCESVSSFPKQTSPFFFILQDHRTSCWGSFYLRVLECCQ